MSFEEKLGFGCVALSTHSTERSALNMLNRAFDEGITHYDTAPLYGRGYSERILGKFISKHRNNITISTKFGLPFTSAVNIPSWAALPLNSFKRKFHKTGIPSEINESIQSHELPERKISLESVSRSLENSLKSLQTGYIDFYLLHEGIPAFIDNGAIDFLIKMKEEGIIRKIGIATSASILKTQKLDDYWDVLQYENDYKGSSHSIMELFPDKIHFQHSVLKNIRSNFRADTQTAASVILALCMKRNQKGKILFSTSVIRHFKNNIEGIKALWEYSEEQLVQILDALH